MRIMITGGGTGGHIYPALAIAEHVKALDAHAEILYIGAKLGMEKDLVTKTEIPFKQIDVEPLNKKLSFKTLKSLFTGLRGVTQARKEIKRFNPDIIIGTGGYVTGPLVLAGALYGVPTIIHEQNAFPGMANRKLQKYVNTILVTFESSREHFEAKSKIVYSGLPIMDAFKNTDRSEARKKLGFSETDIVIMTVGGSNGALKLNEIMMETYDGLRDLDNLKIIHVSGKRYYEVIQSRIDEGLYLVNDKFELINFMEDMPNYLSAVDLVISRAGASTINEIIATNTPSIIIPSPNVANNHQFYNAKIVDKYGMGMIIKEEELTVSLMTNTIKDLYNTPSKLDIMRENCKQIVIPPTLDIISDEINKLIEN